MNPLAFGDCLFETVRVQDQKVSRRARHIARFERSARFLGYAEDEITRGMSALRDFEPTCDGLYKFVFVRRASLFGDWEPQIIIEQRALPTAARPSLTLVETYVPLDTFAEHKTTSYIKAMHARRSAIGRGFDDAVQVSRDGWVGEASMANIFAMIDGVLVTPRVEGLLPGTVRAAVLEQAHHAVQPIVERRLSVEEIKRATQILLTSAGHVVSAASHLDGRELDDSAVSALMEILCD